MTLEINLITKTADVIAYSEQSLERERSTFLRLQLALTIPILTFPIINNYLHEKFGAFPPFALVDQLLIATGMAAAASTVLSILLVELLILTLGFLVLHNLYRRVLLIEIAKKWPVDEDRFRRAKLSVGASLGIGLALLTCGVVASRFDGGQRIMETLYMRDMILLSSPIFFGNTLTWAQAMYFMKR